jgi:hypothetical protein
MRSPYLLLFLTLWLLACADKLIEEPENLIPRDQMADILYDMALLNAIDNSHPQVLKENNLEVMEFVYEKYGVDSLQFASSDVYYASVPAEYQKIYEAVEERLTERRDSVNKIIQQGQAKAVDSLRRAADYD